jgi:hypothetical protein
MKLFRAREGLDLLDMPQENFMMSCLRLRARMERMMTLMDISNLLDEMVGFYTEVKEVLKDRVYKVIEGWLN